MYGDFFKSCGQRNLLRVCLRPGRARNAGLPGAARGAGGASRLADDAASRSERGSAPPRRSTGKVVGDRSHPASRRQRPVAAFRTRMVLTADRPELQSYDQDRWAGELHYRDLPLRLAMEQLRAVRAANLHLWKRLTPEQLNRIGLHVERGPESVSHIVRLMAGHDLIHRRQIDRILLAAVDV